MTTKEDLDRLTNSIMRAAEYISTRIETTELEKPATLKDELIALLFEYDQSMSDPFYSGIEMNQFSSLIEKILKLHEKYKYQI